MLCGKYLQLNRIRMVTLVNRWCDKTECPVDKSSKRAAGHLQRQCMRKKTVWRWSFRSCREQIQKEGQVNDNYIIGLSVSWNLLWFWSSVYVKYYRLQSRKNYFLQALDLAKTNAQSNFELLIFVLLLILLFVSYLPILSHFLSFSLIFLSTSCSIR